MCVATPPNFIYTHTMIRIKNAEMSLDFYTRILGMTLVRKRDFFDAKFTLYFLAYLQPHEIVPEDENTLKHWLAKRSGVLELTHNWGTETDVNFTYHNGNSNPQGYGHICLSVPDFSAAIAWFDSNKVPFQKRPEEGRMKSVAFIKDPDDYWIEIIQQ